MSSILLLYMSIINEKSRCQLLTGIIFRQIFYTYFTKPFTLIK